MEHTACARILLPVRRRLAGDQSRGRMVGRVLTAVFMPLRPDVNDLINERARPSRYFPVNYGVARRDGASRIQTRRPRGSSPHRVTPGAARPTCGAARCGSCRRSSRGGRRPCPSYAPPSPSAAADVSAGAPFGCRLALGGGRVAATGSSAPVLAGPWSRACRAIPRPVTRRALGRRVRASRRGRPRRGGFRRPPVVDARAALRTAADAARLGHECATRLLGVGHALGQP